MSVKLLTEHNLELLGLTGGFTGSSESVYTCQNATLLEITSAAHLYEMVVRKGVSARTINLPSQCKPCDVKNQ